MKDVRIDFRANEICTCGAAVEVTYIDIASNGRRRTHSGSQCAACGAAEDVLARDGLHALVVSGSVPKASSILRAHFDFSLSEMNHQLESGTTGTEVEMTVLAGMLSQADVAASVVKTPRTLT